MQKFLNKLESKFGRYAVSDLINYFIVLYVASTVLSIFVPNFYYYYLALDFNAIKAGQIWRILTFVMAPAPLNSALSILFFIITVQIYYLFGHALERVWGAFRFNLFFIGGIVLTLLAELILYIVSGYPYYLGGMTYIYQSMFFAFCTIFPDQTFMIYFILPVKAKILALADALLLTVDLIRYLMQGNYAYAVALVIAMLNFLLFFYSYKGLSRYSPKQVKRRVEFQKQVSKPMKSSRHKCAICGRTEETNPELNFRFCSKCAGNREYCEDHLFTHNHIQL